MKKISIQEVFCNHSPHHSKLIGCSILCLMLLTISCGDNSTGNEPEGPGGEFVFEAPDYGLFLSIGGNTNGLYFIDHVIAEAFKVGDGNTGIEENGTGLTHTGVLNPMIGSNAFALHQIELDGSSFSIIGDPTGQAFTEGLAFDEQQNVLYASSNGFLHIRNPNTGETIETVLSPPNQPDIEGLAFDPHSRTLYGLARGFESHPEQRRELYFMDVNVPTEQWVWQTTGDTGGLWENAGLAYNRENSMLYASGRRDDPGALFQIDPGTGTTTRIGDTGLQSAEGGLTWVPVE